MVYLRSLLILASGTIMVRPSVGVESFAPRGNTISLTFPSGDVDDGLSGTLTIDPNVTYDYFKNEVGIDVDKLRRHPELFSTGAVGNYTFPAGSGAEGTLFWNFTGHNGINYTIAANEHLTCSDCLAICASTWIVPFGWIICLVCSTKMHCIP